MKNKIFFILGFIAIVVLVAVSAFKIGMEFNHNDIDITWDAFNFSLAMLELYIVVFTIGIGVLGVWGYSQIEKTCVSFVEKRVKKYDKYFETQVKKYEIEFRNLMNNIKKDLDLIREYPELVKGKGKE